MIKNWNYIVLCFMLLFCIEANGQQVIQAEYFWDTDPGQGLATPILALDGGLDEAIEQVFASTLTMPSTGLHTFNLRVKGQDGAWSNAFTYAIHVRNNTAVTRDIKLTQAEYFWDTDPGQGLATPILALDGALDEAIEQVFTSSLTMPSTGHHTFNLRVKGQDGAWSNVFTYAIHVRNNTTATRDIKLIQAEYFWDTDPGQGLATPILALDGALDEAIEQVFTSSLTMPSTGHHTYNLRVKGQDGAWSNIFTYAIHVRNNTIATRDIKLIQAEYFWDTDPGQGLANPIFALDGALDEALEQVFAGTLTPPGSIGPHLFSLRVKGEDGTWSTPFSHVVNVLDSTSYTTQNFTICGGDSIIGPSGGTAYTTAGTYFDTLVNVFGYDSIITTNLMVYLPTDSTLSVSSCGNYTWGLTGLTYTSSGLYKDTLINARGCDSIVTLDLTINTTVSGTDIQISCGSYTWINGQTYTSSNNTATYTISGGSVNGCDSVVTLNLTIINSSNGIDVQTACGSYTWIDGQTYTLNNNTATYTIAGGAANGCDSVVSLDLTILSPATSTDAQTACGSYTWIDGQTYTSSNNTATYTIAGGATNGCDSVVTLNLIITGPSNGVDVQTACGSYTWIDGQTYTSSNNTATYTIAGGATNGCDSVVTLDLIITGPSNGVDVQTACGSYTWIDGNTYSSSNNTATYTITGGAANGCDSVVTLNLIISGPSNGIDLQTACGSYQWIDGQTYTSSNSTATYTITGGAANGCDSVITLNLTIITVIDNTVFQNGATLTANNGNATYQWIDCDNANAAISGATSQVYTATANGNYAVVLTENGCTDTSACVNVVLASTQFIANEIIKVYPNPTTDYINIDFPNAQTDIQLRLYNTTGQVVLDKRYTQRDLIQVALPQLSGLYLLELQTDKGTAVFRVVKE